MKKQPNKKRCSRCRQFKSISDFAPCKTGTSGVYGYCRVCASEYRRNRNPSRQTLDEKDARRQGLKKLGLKTCSSCKSIKPLDDFYGDDRHADGKQSFCKECFNQTANDRYLKREYGISSSQFVELLAAQQGLCAICRRPPKKFRFNVDHCHTTHRIRALLCVNCNTNLLPVVERFPEWVARAIEYLKHPPAFDVIGEIQVPETNQSRLKSKSKRRARAKPPTADPQAQYEQQFQGETA